LEIEMRVSPVIVPLAIVAVLAGVQAGSAQTGQSRQPTATRSPSVNPQTRAKAVSPRAPSQAEKDWMDRASAASNGGAGGGM
jgi:hypothetical protein